MSWHIQLEGADAGGRLAEASIAAPGNKIVSAEALGASLTATILAARVWFGRGCVCDAERDEHGDGRGERRRGAGARGEPEITPAQVKMTLQSSATFMPEVGLVGAGAGSLNAAAAIGVALNGPVQQTTAIGGETVQSSGVTTLTAEVEGC